MKKLLAIVISMAMIVAMMPTVVWANPNEQPAAANTVVAKIGDTEYTDLHTALEAAQKDDTVTLQSNITLTGDWSPIANFEGTLDGNNKTIYGLSVKSTSSTTDVSNNTTSGAGLFAYLRGDVKNLTIDGAVINVPEAAQNVGVLAGRAEYKAFTNVKITNATIQSNAQYVGGLIGFGYGNILGCVVSGSKITGKDQVGGLVGYHKLINVQNNKLTNNTITATEERAGGIFGKLQVVYRDLGNGTATLSGCTVSGGSATAPDYAGGIAGQLMGAGGEDDTNMYNITGNKVENFTLNAEKEKSAFATIRSGNYTKFLGALGANVTDNTLEDITSTLDESWEKKEIYTNFAVYEHFVARIDEVKYINLNAAIEAAEKNEKIELLADCVVSPVEIKKDITIEGNKHTVTGWGEMEEGYPAIDVYSKVTFNEINFQNFSCDYEQTVNEACVIAGYSGCDLTITNCSFKNFNRQAIMFAPGSGGNMNVESCTFDCTANKPEFSIQKAMVIEPGTDGSQATIKNCKITCAKSTTENWTSGGIEIFSGTVSVEGCTLTSCDEGILVSREYFNNHGEEDYDVSSTVTLKDTKIYADNAAVAINCYKGGGTTAKVYIQSGEYEGYVLIDKSNKGDATDEDMTKCTLSVTGGTFSMSPKAYVADGYKVYKYSDSKYAVADSNPSGYYWTEASTDEQKAEYDFAGTKIYYGGGSSSTTTDNVVNKTEDKTADTTASTTATVENKTITTVEGKTTTTATVDNNTATKIVEKAVENKSKEVVVNTATAETVTETAAGTTTEIELPELTVQALSEKTAASVTIKSDAAEVTLDKAAVDGLAAQAGDDGYVRLVVETVKQEAKRMEVDLKLVTSKGTVTDFRGGNVSVTVKLNGTLASKNVVCVYIDNYGIYHKVTGSKNADGTYNFITGHFSKYAIMALDEADEVIAEQTAKVKELAGKIQLKARSVKTPKGNIKVTLKITKGADSFKALENLGYTLKYQFYRSTEMRKNYKYKFETLGAPYTNTDAKKGTRYYYKARIVVYDTEGNMVLKTNLKKCWYATRIK